jgi:hypothetical protein
MSRSRRNSEEGTDMPDLEQSMPVVTLGTGPFPQGFTKKDAETSLSHSTDVETTGDSKAPLALKRSSSAMQVTVPTYKVISSPHAKGKRVKWARPVSLIHINGRKSLDLAAGPANPLYDADEDDTRFFKSWKAKNSARREWTLDVFEKAIEVLEREMQGAENRTEWDKSEIDLKCRNAATIAKAEYILGALRHKRQGSVSTSAHRARHVLGSELEQEIAVNGEIAAKDMARSLEHGTRKSKRTIEELVPISLLAEALSMDELNSGLKTVYEYWIAKRKKEGGPLINPAFLKDKSTDHRLETEHPQVVAGVYSRLRDLREDMERVRLIADTARKREKIKKELVKLGPS